MWSVGTWAFRARADVCQLAESVHECCWNKWDGSQVASGRLLPSCSAKLLLALVVSKTSVCPQNSSNRKIVSGWQSWVLSAGWSGSGGLGAKEQGIQDPIKGGDIRDKWDQYKGVGVALDDPYENYRRNKSYSFIARMKAREECKWMFLSNLNKFVDLTVILCYLL